MVNELKQGIAQQLKALYPNVPTYFNSNQQNTKLPCFFIFLIQKPQVRGIGKRRYYEMQFDIVYIVHELQTNTESQLNAISDALDNIDTINYLVKEGDEYVSKSIVNIIGANPEINDNELHYKIDMRLDYILNDDSEVVIETKYELKGAK